jgi:hypothetical protein
MDHAMENRMSAGDTSQAKLSLWLSFVTIAQPYFFPSIRAGSSGPADLSVIIVHVIYEFISAASRRISLTVSVGWK